MTSNWKKYKLQDLTLKQNQGVNTTTEKVKYCENGTHKVVRAKNILPYKLLLDDVVYIDDNTFKKINDNCKPQKNDILYTNIGSQLGNASLVTKNEDFIIAWNVLRLQLDQTKILPNYCLYLLNSNENKQKIVSLNSSSTMPFVSGTELSKVEFTIPPLETQQKISKVLSVIDDKIELNNSLNNNLEQQAMALFKQKIIENCDNKNGIIGDYCSVKSGYAFKGTWWQDNGVKVIKIKTIDNDSINLNDCSYVSNDKIEFAKDFIVQGGDLLIAMTGATIGKFAVIPKINEQLLVNQRVGKFFLGTEPLNRLAFLYCSLKQQDIITEIINRGQGSAQPNISSTDIMTTPCYLPNKCVIDEFNELCKPIFETIITNKYENEQLANLRDTLLPKLMSGEIDVSNVDISTDKLSFSEV